MDFYEEASLVMVPSGYKDQKVYSSVPDDGSADLTFSRASTATRVNSDGYIEKAKVNLLLQSNQFDTTWTSVNSSLTGSQSGHDGSSDAWKLEATSASGSLFQYNTTSGVSSFSIYAKAGNISWVRLRYDNTTSADINAWFNLSDGSIATDNGIASYTENVGNGWWRVVVQANTSDLNNVRIYPASSDGNNANTGEYIYIQDAQLNYGLVAQDYIETTTASVTEGVAIDVPRLNYDPANPTCPSLLLEPSRTNAMLHSEYIGPYFFYTNASANNNQTTSPEGVTNAASLVPDATSGLHQIASSSITASGTFTLSAFVKAGELNKVAIREYNATGAYASFDLSTGTKIEDNVSGAAFIEAYSNGWYRIGVTYTYSGNIRLAINALSNSYTSGNPSSGGTYWSSNGTDKLYIYGLQCELGASYQSSYIPTYGSSATRTAEVSYASNQFNNIGQTEGTVYAEFFLPVNVTSTENRFSLSDNTLNNWFFVSLPESGNKTRMYLRVGASTAVDVQTATSIFNYGQVNKVAMAYKSGDSRVYVNGVSVLSSTNTFGSPTSELDVFVITGSNGTGSASTQNISNQIKQALLFKTRLPNSDLATLTSL